MRDNSTKEREEIKGGLLRALDLMFVPTSELRFMRDMKRAGDKLNLYDYEVLLGTELVRDAAYTVGFLFSYF